MKAKRLVGLHKLTVIIAVLKKGEAPNPFPEFHATIIKMPHIL